jgi:hypothetical protein
MKNFVIGVLLMTVVGLAAWIVWSQTVLSVTPATGAAAPAGLPKSRGPFAYVQVELPETIAPARLRGRSGTSQIEVVSSDMRWRGLQIVQHSQAAIMTADGLFATILGDANSPIRQTAWYKSINDPKKAISWLKKHVVASPVPDSALIKVYLDELPSPAGDAATIIENVVNRHLEMQQLLRSNQVLDRTTALNNLKIKFETRIRELLDRQNNRMLQLNIGAVGSPGRYTATDVEIQSLLNKQVELQATAAAAQARLEELNQRVQEPKTLPYSESVERDPVVLKLRERLLDCDLELRTAAATQAADSPAVREAQRQRDIVNEQLEKVRGDLRTAVFSAELLEATKRAEAAKIALQICEKRIDQLKAVLGDLAIAMNDYLMISDDLAKTRGSLQEVREELEEISSATAVSVVSWVQRPVKSDQEDDD